MAEELEALEARHAALETLVAERTRERDATRQLLEDARERARLPVLDDLRVAAPCSASWAGMTGDERVRACADCKQNVYNLTAMTRDQAEALIREREGRLCVRYFQRSDGTILLADCVVGVRRRRRRRLVIAGAAVTLASAVLYKAWPRAPEMVARQVVDVQAPPASKPVPPPAPIVTPPSGHWHQGLPARHYDPPPHKKPAHHEPRDDGDWVMGKK
jgi:hypothetical protein